MRGCKSCKAAGVICDKTKPRCGHCVRQSNRHCRPVSPQIKHKRTDQCYSCKNSGKHLKCDGSQNPNCAKRDYPRCGNCTELTEDCGCPRSRRRRTKPLPKTKLVCIHCRGAHKACDGKRHLCPKKRSPKCVNCASSLDCQGSCIGRPGQPSKEKVVSDIIYQAF